MKINGWITSLDVPPSPKCTECVRSIIAWREIYLCRHCKSPVHEKCTAKHAMKFGLVTADFSAILRKDWEKPRGET